ncbi:MAG: RecX family transcriptional regulator [Coprobacillus sp.]|nr:RecX family transcriptional regulator [Coprobacillus sp.]
MPSEKPGKKVKSIKKYKETVHIYFTSGERLIISYETYIDYPLYEGKEITSKEYQDIVNSEKVSSLYIKTAKSLLAHPKSEKKVREALYDKGLGKKDVERVVSRLISEGYLNEKAFVEGYQYIYNERNLGKRSIISKLKEKGYTEEAINSLKFDTGEEKEKINKLLPTLEKKYARYPLNVKKEKIRAALLSKGYDYDLVREALTSVTSEDIALVDASLSKEMSKQVKSKENKYNGKELKTHVINSLLQKGYSYNKIIKEWNEKYETN